MARADELGRSGPSYVRTRQRPEGRVPAGV